MDQHFRGNVGYVAGRDIIFAVLEGLDDRPTDALKRDAESARLQGARARRNALLRPVMYIASAMLFFHVYPEYAATMPTTGNLAADIVVMLMVPTIWYLATRMVVQQLAGSWLARQDYIASDAIRREHEAHARIAFRRARMDVETGRARGLPPSMMDALNDIVEQIRAARQQPGGDNAR